MSPDPWTAPVEPLDPVLLAETLAALSDRLAAQEDLLAALVERLDRGDTPAGRWTWRHLTAAQSETLLAGLADWVSWLVDRYQLDHTRNQIPSCWADHPVAVEELTALMVSWKAAYGSPARPPSDALIAWHDRWLWPCLTRINEGLQVWNGCRAGQHKDGRPAGRGLKTEDPLARKAWVAERTPLPCQLSPSRAACEDGWSVGASRLRPGIRHQSAFRAAVGSFGSLPDGAR